MLDLQTLAIDVDAAENGKWFTYLNGSELLIRRYNNERADQLRTQLTMERWEELSTNAEDPESIVRAGEVLKEIELAVITEEILVDWKGIGFGGEIVKYTPEVGRQFLGDKRFRDLRKFVENQSMNTGHWREKVASEITESVKDSAAS